MKRPEKSFEFYVDVTAFDNNDLEVRGAIGNSVEDAIQFFLRGRLLAAPEPGFSSDQSSKILDLLFKTPD